MKVGYRRVSTVEQRFDRQELGCVERVFEEKISGGNTECAALQEMIAFVRMGDEVVVYSIDRLTRLYCLSAVRFWSMLASPLLFSLLPLNWL